MSEPIDVVIYVSGGIVQSVQSSLANPDKTLRVFTVDYDNGVDDENAPVINDGRASVGQEIVFGYDADVDAVRAAAQDEPLPTNREAKARRALTLLLAARELLGEVEAPRTLARLAHTISSAKGAVRAAGYRDNRLAAKEA